MRAAAAIRSMLAGGLSIDHALIAVEAMEDAARAASMTNAERQAKHRAKKRAETEASNNESNVTPVTEVISVTSVTSVTPADEPRVCAVFTGEEVRIVDTPEPTVLSPQSSAPSRQGRRKRNTETDAVRAELAAVLDAPHVEAVFGYRLARKAAQTGYAARLLASELAKTGSPNEAADLMILRDWKGFKIGWWDREQAETTHKARDGPRPVNGNKPQTNLQFDTILDSLSDDRPYDTSAF